MSFLNPWGLLGLLALPAIAYIHMFHRRFPPLEIAGAHLWGMETQRRTAGRRRENLPITRSLLLELLAALLISLLIAQPRFEGSTGIPHLVVVLDSSASMSAKSPLEKLSFRDTAIQSIESRMKNMGSQSVVTIISTGRRPSMIAGPGIRLGEARQQLDSWTPNLTKHSFAPAWDLASQFAENADELVFITDQLPDEKETVPERMRIISVGRKLNNVAFTAARWTFDSQTRKGTLFFRVINLGRANAGVVVKGRAKDRTIFEETVALSPNQEKPLQFKVPGGIGKVDVSLESQNDGLTLDNQVTLVEPIPRILTVVVNYKSDSAERGLIQRVVQTIPDLQPGAISDADLLIGPATKPPPNQSELWWLGIGPLKTTEAASEDSKLVTGPFLMEKRHPLLNGVVLGGIAWGGVQPFQAGTAPLISAGAFPLLTLTNNNAGVNYLMNIDLKRSNITESPDWPILISNFITECRNSRPGLRRWNYRLNEQIRFRVMPFESKEDSDEEEEPVLKLIQGEDSRHLARTPIVELPPIEKPGVYEIQDGEESLGKFSINFFDRDESEISNLTPGERKPAIEKIADEWEIDNPLTIWILIGLIIVMLALFADWYVLQGKRAKSNTSF